MAEFDIPPAGLVLDRLSPSTNLAGATNKTEAVQVMQLDLAHGILDELIRCARHGSKPMYLTFGKTVVRLEATSASAPFQQGGQGPTDMSIVTPIWDQISKADCHSIIHRHPNFRLRLHPCRCADIYRPDEPCSRSREGKGGDRRR